RSSESSAQTTGDPTATTDDAEVIQDLRAQVQTQQTEICQLQTERDDLMRRAEAKSSEASVSADGSADPALVADLEARLATQTSETDRLKQLAAATSTVAILQAEKAKLQGEVDDDDDLRDQTDDDYDDEEEDEDKDD
ncbi:hypothetical protein CRUP_023324, partial [Coryphaenoides rupestris]